MLSKIVIVGAGSFGTAIANLLAKKNNEVLIWDINKDIIDDINENRINSKFFPDVILHKNIKGIHTLEQYLNENLNFIILAVPSKAISSVCLSLKDKVNNNTSIINISKGIDLISHKRLSVIINEILPKNPLVILSGPTHAEEIIKDLPTTIVASSSNITHAETVQELFLSNNFRVYTNSDLISAEIGGAVKNIIAVAAGILSGIGYGDNALAALMTRGMVEISRIGEKLGGRKETFFGLTGMGDLIVTCTSVHSRNRRAGLLIAKGFTVEEAIKEVGMVVEGIEACKSFYKLKELNEVDMPITDTLYDVLFNSKCPKEAVNELMNREVKMEFVY